MDTKKPIYCISPNGGRGLRTGKNPPQAGKPSLYDCAWRRFSPEARARIALYSGFACGTGITWLLYGCVTAFYKRYGGQ